MKNPMQENGEELWKQQESTLNQMWLQTYPTDEVGEWSGRRHTTQSHVNCTLRATTQALGKKGKTQDIYPRKDTC